LLLAAVIVAIASAMGKVPLWISVILLCIVVTLVVYPGRV
jgi:hypothetical protein